MANNFVPQFILENDANQRCNGRFQAVALFVDLSGFSALTDQLMAYGQHGAEVLAGGMEGFFEPLIEAVYSQAGFITGFAGDAFTAIFPETDTAWQALAATLDIQEEMRPLSNRRKCAFCLSARISPNRSTMSGLPAAMLN